MALFVSYSQNFEDVMLWRALGKIQNGFYIDIGAASPAALSVTKAFYERGWRGINVEPNISYFKELQAVRPEDTNLQVVIGQDTHPIDFYLIPGTGLSTLDKEVAHEHYLKGFPFEQITVNSMRLDQLFELYVKNQEVHFLKIDVEGAEEDVVKGNNWSSFRPWIVVLEATRPLSNLESFSGWEPLLLKHDYLFVYTDGINRFYVAKEHADLSSAFKYPPNAFDWFEWDPIGEKKKLEQNVAMLETKVSETEFLRAKTEARAVAAESSTVAAEAKIMELKAKIDWTETQLNQIRNSFFWRLTYPLRWLNLKRVEMLKWCKMSFSM